MKRFMIVITVVVLVLALSMTGFTAKKKNMKNIVIGFDAPYSTHPSWQGMKAGVMQAAKEGGFKAIWNGPAVNGDLQGTVETMETFLAQKVDGIAICPLSPSAFEPVCAKSIKAGVPVITYGGDILKQNLRLTFVGTDNPVCALQQVKGLQKALGKDDLQICIIMSNLDTENQRIQVEAIRKYCKELAAKGAKAEVIDVRDDNGAMDDAKTYDTAAAMLKAHPQTNILICTEGAGAFMIGKAVADAGLKGKVLVSGYDDQPRCLDAVKNGTVYSLMVQNFYNWGYLPTKYLARAIANGEKFPSFINAGVIEVTKDNLNTYAADLEKMH